MCATLLLRFPGCFLCKKLFCIFTFIVLSYIYISPLFVVFIYRDPDLSNVPKWSQDVLTTTASPTMTTLKPTTLSPTHRPAATTTALPLPPSRPPQTSTSTTAPSTQSSTTTTSTQEPTKTSFPPEVRKKICNFFSLDREV